MKFISRINTIFTSTFLDEMYDLYKQHKFYVTNSDGTKVRVEDVRHMKALKFREKLSNYLTEKGISFTFLGDGTNRMAILIDGYVFKLALDDQGYIDNLTEFKMSREAQPYVTKTYETNGLFCVAEYVTLISYDEFVKQKAKILEILDLLSNEYLLGDMGWTKKNYCNWGYRKNSKDLVILDYGHMLKMDPDKMICQDCGGFLHYNSTFTEIQCINCNKKSDFMNMKSRISKREEMEMIDGYLNNSINTEDEQVEVEEVKIEQEVVYDEEPDEIVSNRFESFKPERRKRFSDMMEDEDEVIEDDYEYDFNDALILLGNNVVEKPNNNVKKQIPKELSKIKDHRLRGLLMMEREDAEFSLSQDLATGKIDFKDYGYYMSRLEEYFNQSEDEEIESFEDDEPLVTIGEVIENKQKEEVKPQVEDDPYDNFDYYEEMFNIVNEGQQEVIQAPVDEVVEEDVDEEEMEMIDKMNQMMQNLVEMDDDGEGGMYPEDFLMNNMSDLGFDEEDSEEDIEAYDAVLANIRKGNHVDLDELEDMIEEEGGHDIEEAYMATLEVFEPQNNDEIKEENKEDNHVIRLEEGNKSSDNVFKVRRDNNQTEMRIETVDNGPVVVRKQPQFKSETTLQVNEVEDDADDSFMGRVFKHMQETGVIQKIDEEE